MSATAYKRLLQHDGFAHIYEWTDTAHTVYPPHTHKGAVSFYVLRGSIEITINGSTVCVCAGERMNVPPQTLHSAIVGNRGCTYVVGEQIEGDS